MKYSGSRLVSLILAAGLVHGTILAQNTAHSSASAKRSSGAASTKSAAKSKKKTTARSSTRIRRLSRAFVASSDLRPMAHQLIENRSAAAYAGVEGYARRHAQTEAGALAWLAIGYARVLDRDHAKAVTALKLAQPHGGELREYVDYYLAGSYAALGNPEQVSVTLRDYAVRYPDSLLLRDAMLCYGSALAASGRDEEAARVLERYRTPARPDLELALGKQYAKLGETARAAEALRRVYYAYPLSPQAAEARVELDRLAAQATLAAPSFAERKARADLLAQMRHNDDAAREYRALLGDADAAARDDLQIGLGLALHRSGNDGEAATLLNSAPETSDELSAQRWAALAEIARGSGDDGRMNDALAHLRQMGGSSDTLELALLQAGNQSLLRKDYDRAIDYYRELQQRFPNGKRASYAHWKAAWLTLRQGRKEEARKEFEEQVAVYPNSAELSAALYWRARLAEEDGDVARARVWYQKLTLRFHQYYYSELARARLDSLPAGAAAYRDPILEKLPLPSAGVEFAVTATEPPAENVRFQKSRLLQNGGLTELAIKELRAAAPEGTGWVWLQAARYYQEDGQYHRALETLKRAVPGYMALEIAAMPRPYWETLFPRPFWAQLKRYAEQNGLDPYLVASLIRQESEFNPGAISRADALGLMQLLPKTGRKVARELKVSKFSTNQLLTPDLNLRLGTRYFRTMVNQFDGQLEYALAAYNAGADRVQNWRTDGSYRDIDEFVESIPFTETREYVQAIVRNAAIYKRLYGNE